MAVVFIVTPSPTAPKLLTSRQSELVCVVLKLKLLVALMPPASVAMIYQL